MYSVFTYGTLQVPDVMQAVTGKNFKSDHATLIGFQRFKFKERTFPGIIKDKNFSTEGILYKNVDEQSLARLDIFEDVAYERELLDIHVDKEIKQAFVYVTREDYKKYLSDDEWSLEEFKRDHLKLYLKRIIGN